MSPAYFRCVQTGSIVFVSGNALLVLLGRRARLCCSLLSGVSVSSGSGGGDGRADAGAGAALLPGQPEQLLQEGRLGPGGGRSSEAGKFWEWLPSLEKPGVCIDLSEVTTQDSHSVPAIGNAEVAAVKVQQGTLARSARNEQAGMPCCRAQHFAVRAGVSCRR